MLTRAETPMTAAPSPRCSTSERTLTDWDTTPTTG
jgi:hypothetical protein